MKLVTLENKMAKYIRECLENDPPEMRLPSISYFAKIFRTNKDNISAILQQFQDDGIVKIKPSSGCYINENAYNILHDNRPNWPSFASKSWYKSDMGRGQSRHVNFEVGVLSPEFGYHQYIAMALAEAEKVWMKSKWMFNDFVDGSTQLKQSICKYMETKGVRCEQEQVIITSNIQQSAIIIFRTLFGDDVVSLTHPNAASISSIVPPFNMKTIYLKYSGDGIDLEQLETLAAGTKKLILSITPVHCYPLGRTISDSCIREIMRICMKYKVPVIESDLFSPFYPGSSCLKQYDTNDIVIYSGTLQRVATSGVSCSWIIAPKETLPWLKTLARKSNIFPDVLPQIVMDIYIKSGFLNEYIADVLPYFKYRCEFTNALIEKHLGKYVGWEKNNLGVHGWLKLKNRELMPKITKNSDVTVTEGAVFGKEFDNCFSIYPVCATEKDLELGLSLLQKGLEGNRT